MGVPCQIVSKRRNVRLLSPWILYDAQPPGLNHKYLEEGSSEPNQITNSTHRCIHPSTHPPTHPRIHLSVHPLPIHPCAHPPSGYPSIHRPVHPPIHLFTPIHPSAHPPIIHPCTHPSFAIGYGNVEPKKETHRGLALMIISQLDAQCVRASPLWPPHNRATLQSIHPS